MTIAAIAAPRTRPTALSLRGWRGPPALLAAPLVGFLLVFFLIPLGTMLWRSVDDPEVALALPRTIASLQTWNGVDVPSEASFTALAADLIEARRAGTLAAAARRLNYDTNGLRTVVMNAARRAAPSDSGSYRDYFGALDPAWSDRATWAAIRRASGPLTDFYLLAAVDLRRDADGSIVAAPPTTAIYRDVLLRTFGISLGVTVICLALAFPIAYLIASLSTRAANILLLLVLLPFWTSLLVRTTAWVVLLQNEGVINAWLLRSGLISQPVQMVFNRFGVYVAMVHVLLPFMVLPLFSVMKQISPSAMRAALSLGAAPTTAFVRVYLPQTLPGVSAGCLLVFILALGYYITPALVGGGGDQMVSYFIAFNTTDTANWGMASALGAVLLCATLVAYAAYQRLVGGGVKLG